MNQYISKRKIPHVTRRFLQIWTGNEIIAHSQLFSFIILRNSPLRPPVCRALFADQKCYRHRRLIQVILLHRAQWTCVGCRWKHWFNWRPSPVMPLSTSKNFNLHTYNLEEVRQNLSTCPLRSCGYEVFLSIICREPPLAWTLRGDLYPIFGLPSRPCQFIQPDGHEKTQMQGWWRLSVLKIGKDQT